MKIKMDFKCKNIPLPSRLAVCDTTHTINLKNIVVQTKPKYATTKKIEYEVSTLFQCSVSYTKVTEILTKFLPPYSVR